MREILFRGKRKEDNEWIYGLPHEFGSETLILGKIIADYDADYCILEHWWVVDSETVGQYTGLIDKNGNKIFEGDILKQDNPYHPNLGFETTVEIIWAKNGFKHKYVNQVDIKMMPDITLDSTFDLWDYELANHAVIIGNIHDK